ASLEALEKISAAASKTAELKDLPFYVGALHAELGHYTEAAENLRAFLRRDPGHLEARTQMADALYRAGRTAEAAVQWERIAQFKTSKARHLQQEGEADWRAGRREPPVSKLKQARQFDPSNTELVLTLARVQAWCGDLEAAAQTLKQHLASYPDR